MLGVGFAEAFTILLAYRVHGRRGFPWGTPGPLRLGAQVLRAAAGAVFEGRALPPATRALDPLDAEGSLALAAPILGDPPAQLADGGAVLCVTQALPYRFGRDTSPSFVPLPKLYRNRSSSFSAVCT